LLRMNPLTTPTRSDVRILATSLIGVLCVAAAGCVPTASSDHRPAVVSDSVSAVRAGAIETPVPAGDANLHASVVGTQPAKIRVLTYNIHHGVGIGGAVDLDQIAELIRRVSPDIVALQEVEFGTTRTLGVDQTAVLAEATGMTGVFGRNLDFRGGGFGNAILSRYPIKTFRNQLLPFRFGSEPRGVLDATIELPGGGVIHLLSTHLDYHQDETERLLQSSAIEDLAMGFGDTPVILAGDLNAEPTSGTIRSFRRRWTSAGSIRLLTYPALFPQKRIDYVMVRPVSRWKVVSTIALGGATSSDHRALLTILELST